ncbi:hypothetical protein M0805_008646 [Coniferiporia weirii]|nr:hypothetical protein M0805_008646 [Coniferiporia weirii]
MAKLWSKFKRNLNFFRIHVLFFTFTPLIFSAIFYASNGEIHISYIDSLFNCVSAMVVCGLASVDLSSLTGFQQALLFVQSCIGNPVVVSWVMVYIRRRYFAKKLEHIVEAEIARQKEIAERGLSLNVTTTWGRRLSRVFTHSQGAPIPPVAKKGEGEQEEKKRPGFFNKKSLRKLRTDMIRRMDDAPKPIDPNGWITQEQERPVARPRMLSQIDERVSGIAEEKMNGNRSPSPQPIAAAVSDSSANGAPASSVTSPAMARSPTLQHGTSRGGVPLGHTMTVEFRTPERENRERQHAFSDGIHITRSRSPARSRRLSTVGDIVHDDRNFIPPGGVPSMQRNATMHTYRSQRTAPQRNRAMNRGMGGFPYPQVLLIRLIKKLFPKLGERFVRTITLPRTQTFSNAMGSLGGAADAKSVQYISFNPTVGRNSKFHMLTEENLQELGGVEYRALTALLWIVGGYHVIIQLVSFTIIAPYISTNRWRSVFEPPDLHRYVPPVWFSAFQVVSAYTNSGMSLVDASMIPFQKAYPMIFVMAFLVVAGNTGFPVLLRLTIWIITKIVPFESRLNETLHFLLDHPRRCFVYLFPSHQTWFLLTVLIMLNATDWFFFLVLDIGNSTIEVIPLGVRFAIGLLQATAVRAAGFATVTLSALAPAVQALYVMMMYISVYPVAMSVRSTNVYEEKSLGVFEDEESDDDDEPTVSGSRVAAWSRYLAWHARRQLAFDMWWLGLALFLVCIIERSKIQNESNFEWFTIFTIIFELISAYGGVGLSLGVPYANFSFSGAFTPLSKLIVCAVMLRGRHRGLPVAIDRAVMLPFEFKKAGITRETDDGADLSDGNEENTRNEFTEGDGAAASAPAIIEVKPAAPSPAGKPTLEERTSYGLALHPTPSS